MTYYIYMIRCSDQSLYTGITTNMSKRMKEHYYKLKTGAQYTKTRDVVALEGLWSCVGRSNASKLEYRLKQLTKQKKEELLQQPNSIEDDTYVVVKFHSIEGFLEDEKK